MTRIEFLPSHKSWERGDEGAVAEKGVVATMDKILSKKVELLRKDGSAAAELPSSARVIGLLFASSNSETAEFSARLAETCRKTLATGKLVYVVYISLDADDAAMRVQMPDAFVALPQSEINVRDKLWVDLQLISSPSLVLFDGATGRLITKSGMNVVRDDPEGIKYPWVPQTLDTLLGDVLIQSNGKETSRRDTLGGMNFVEGYINNQILFAVILPSTFSLLELKSWHTRKICRAFICGAMECALLKTH